MYGMYYAISPFCQISADELHTHLSLDKDAPIFRAIEAVGRIVGRPVMGGLHHQYVRI
jgi:hypothetical protein